MLGGLEQLVTSLATFIVVRLLHHHVLVIAVVYLVAKVVAVILGSYSVVPLLYGFKHKVVLVHVVTESLVTTGYYKDTQLGIGPLTQFHDLALLISSLFGVEAALSLRLLLGFHHLLDKANFNSIVGLVNVGAVTAKEDSMIY